MVNTYVTAGAMKVMCLGFLRKMRVASRDFNHVVQTARGLHGGGGADHGHDHQHHVDGRAGGLELKAEGQHGQAQPPKDAQADAASLRTHQNAQQNNDKLNNKQRGHDVSKLSTTASAHLRANYRYTECINGPHFPRTP